MTKELKNKTEKDLQKELAETREALRKLRFSISGANSKDAGKGKTLKKLVAQILTVLNNK